MGLNVISNYAANVAHRNLVRTDMQASQSLAKLSSGTRVVSSKDDAASMAIGSRLSAEVSSLRQATVNAGQAVSMLQIADGAMSQVNDILIRMKTLSVQSASGLLSDTERGMLDTEFQALLDEVDRIAADTEFNGNQLVNGSSTTSTSLNSVTAAADNLINAADGFHSIQFTPAVGNAAFDVNYDSTTGVMTVQNLTTGESQGLDISGDVPVATNATLPIIFDDVGTTITLNSAFDPTVSISSTGGGYSAIGGGNTSDVLASTIEITTASGSGAQGLTSTILSIDAAAANASVLTIGAYSGAATVDLSTTGVKTAQLTDGTNTFNISFQVSTAFSNGDTGDLDINGLGAMVFGDTTTDSGTTTFTFKLGTGTVSQVDNVSLSVSSINNASLGLTAVGVGNQINAEAAVGAVSDAIDILNVARASIGAVQNRIEFASANLRISIENAESARSDILDLDVAQEMSNFTSKQVLMQAGVAMLAQANQMPQNLLQLLQG